MRPMIQRLRLSATFALVILAGLSAVPLQASGQEGVRQATSSGASGSSSKDNPRRAERLAITRHAKFAFAGSSNHCQTFASVVAFAVTKSDNKGDLLDDLAHVFIGKNIFRTGDRGIYWVGRTNDSGFRSNLRDGSPQIEHAVAGFILANLTGPGGGGFWGALSEWGTALGRASAPSYKDMALYAYASDLGTRLSRSNMDRFPEAIRRTLCE